MAEFQLLGPVEIVVRGHPVDSGQPRQRTLLAALLVDVGRVVTVDSLVDRVWGEVPPDGARHALHTYFARIRRLLASLDDGDAAAQLLRHPAGYLLKVEPDRVDLHRFRRLADRARDPAVADAQRAAWLREALALWHGEPLAGLYGPWPARVRDALLGQRLDTAVRWAVLELRLGNAGAVVAVLADLAGEYPLAEPLAAMRMRALYAAGRTAEALDCYVAVRKRLVEDLGTEPGPELQRLHQAILRGDLEPPGARAAAAPAPDRTDGTPAAGGTAGTAGAGTAGAGATGAGTDGGTAGTPSTAVPAQLPPGVPGFAGRERELAQLDAMLAEADADPTAVVIAAVSGTAGVGKTALAVHWAHRVADRFPDGQLYVNLRGFDPAGVPVAPAAALRGFLDALGLPPSRVPADFDAQVGTYRSLLAGKRVLVVLDNARDAEQVRPLLPGSPTTLVVVTSRNQLSSLIAAEGARPLSLDLLPAADARRLLSGRLGPDRLDAEPRSVDELIDRCSRLPLALTIVAARAATNAGFPLEALAGELRDTRSRLDAFDAGDPAADVRAVFSWSYRTLSDAAARLFRLLGLHPGPDLAAPAAASLAGLPGPRTRALLAELARANLVAEAVPGRYGFHDLLRAYATDLAAEHDAEADRRAARIRMLDHYLHSAFAAHRLHRPHRDVIAVSPPVAGVAVAELADADRALAWLAAEHANLVAAIALAADTGLDAHAWQLAATMGDFLDRRGHWQEWTTIERTALAAARRLGDRAGLARCHRDLGRASMRQGRMAAALAEYDQALQLYAALDDHLGQANTVLDMAWVANLENDHPRALEQARQALELFRRADHQYGQANALNAVGWEYVLVGDPRQALACCEQALALFRELGDRRSEASTWDSVGYARHHLGEYAQALTSYGNALQLYRATGGDRYYEAVTLNHAGDSHLAAGAPDAAAWAWREALALLEELGHPEAAVIRAKLAALPAGAELPESVGGGA